jgi:phosphoribosylaminoimidazole-succinocarboxamide synthase
MESTKGSFLRSGKVKNIYGAGRGKLLLVYTDRLSSHDVILADTVPYKGEVLCRLSSRCFFTCEKMGIKTHMIEVPKPNQMVVQSLSIIPVEVIERNYLYGSYWKRYQQGEVQLPRGTKPVLAAKLSNPVVEFTTKFEVKDNPITEEQIVSNRWLTQDELSEIKRVTLKLNDLMAKEAENAGFILSDFKLEFGRDEKDNII